MDAPRLSRFPRLASRILRRVSAAFALSLLVSGVAPTAAMAATATFGVGIDADNNPATGCTLATANGLVAGIERVASAVVTTTSTGATVTRLEQQRCSAGSLSAAAVYDSGGWPVGFGNGTGGSAVVEYSIPLPALGATGAMRAVAFGSDDGAGRDAAGPFSLTVAAETASTVVAVPLSPWLLPPLSLLLIGAAAWWRRRHPEQTSLFVLLAFVAGTGLVWAATVLRDGNTGDWAGVAPAVTDTKGDAPANADIVAVFVQQDAASLYLRIDADLRKDAAANQPPIVNPGPAQVITLPTNANLAGSATDDGLPNPPGALTYAWSKVSGPGIVTFGSAASATTTASFSAAGSYVLRLTASDGALSGAGEVTITVNPAGTANQAPVVNAGGDQAITLPAGANLAGSATDDGLPSPPGALTYAWSKVSGPGTVSFGNTANASTTVSFDAAGTYVLRLTASDSALSAGDELTISVSPVGTVNLPPVVSAGANQTITLPAAAALAGTASDDGLPNPPGQLTTTWSLASGPLSGVFFADPASPATTATFSAPGTYVLRLTASDGAGSQSSTVQITVSDGAPQVDTVADRTIEAGNRLQILVQARDGNADDRLTYELVTAPAGATLNPAPLIDWVPTIAQAGQHTFTTRVTDANGNATTTSFRVNVVHTNKPPQLAPQASLTMPAGTAFARTLKASDPDPDDVLTFALVAGPAGMTLSGADLNWPTAGRNPGDYAVTVKVSDPAGSFDQKTFTVTLTQAAPTPVAVDDTYEARVGAVLNVPPAGVLANDLNPGSAALSARKLTDPSAGSITSFAGDGSFTFQAPAAPPGIPLATAKTWNANATWSYGAHEVIGDLDGDGYPDIISHNLNADIRARSGRDGSQLWALDSTSATDCQVMTGYAMNHRVLADVDDSGHPAYVLTTLCAREGSSWHDHIIAYDHLGKVKWVSPPVSKPHPDIRRGAAPVPPGGFTPGGLTWRRGLSAARLKATDPPVLLMRAEITGNDGYTYYVDAANQGHYAACRAATGLVADEGRACRVTFVISGANGAVLQTLVAPNPASAGISGGPDALKELPPIAFDIDGDGRVDLVSGTEVWKQNAAGGFDLSWQLTTPVNDTAVADLDGDGKAEIIHLRSTGANPQDQRGIFVYSHDGQLLRRIPLQTYWFTPLTIADVDGDGRSDIVLGAEGTLYAFRDDGRPIWAYKVPEEAPDNATLAPIYTQPAEGFRIANAAPQVYDLDGDGIAEVVFSANSRIMILDGRTGLRKVDPYWTYSFTYNDVSALMLVDMNNDGHVDIVQNSSFLFNCGFVGFPPGFCDPLVGPIVLSGGTGNAWLPGPKAWPHLQYRSTAIDARSRVLHDTKVSRVFRTPEQQGTVRDPRLAQAASFTYEADDGVARSAPAKVIVKIVPDNKPPAFTSVPPKSVWQRFAPNPPGGLVTNYYDLSATDPDPGDTVTFSLKSAPAWVTMSGPAQIRFEPTCGSYGYPCPWGWTTVIVTATDSRGAATDQIFIVNLTTDATSVPDVVGQSMEAANASLLAAGLQGVVTTEAFSAQPAGTVLAQEAVAGAMVGRYDDVRLTVSKGPQPVAMPSVVGQPLATANVLLAGAGFTVNVTTAFSTTVPAGEIMTQSPAFGTELVPATAPPVNLTVSAGGPLPAPVASIVLEPGPGPALRLAGDELQYKAVAILTDGTSADVTLTAAWGSTTAGVASVNTAGVAKAIAAGATTISASLSGKTGQGTLNVAARALGDNTRPTAQITTPADGASVTGPTAIVGTASDANFLRYELAIALAGDDSWTVIGEGTSPVTNGTLGTLDPTLLRNDLYMIRLRVFDRAENVTDATQGVQLTGEMKVGLFSMSFPDLSLPMAGIPLTVTRTYDSRVKSKGDFGVGWQLDIRSLRLRTNRVPGTGWVRNSAGLTVALVPTSEHKVSVTLSDGRVEEFDLQLAPMSAPFSLNATSVVGYAPRPGTVGSLQALGNTSLLILNDGAEDALVDDVTLNTFEPEAYRYTTPGGTQMEMEPGGRVRKVTDASGNSVTFGPNGIVHSSGKSIVFGRDAQGRIVSIADPVGNVQTYAYDGNGDLVQHTDPAGNSTRFHYDRVHGLLRVVDPLNRIIRRNEFDASGRLIATTSASGARTTFAHDPGARQEIVTDALGNVSLLEYDTRGNLTRSTDTLGGVSTYSYDSEGNQTSVTNPLGATITRSFDSRRNLLSITNPLGHTTSLSYDAADRVTALVDPLGRRTSFAYDAAGNLLSRTNALGQTEAFTYDAQGKLLTATAATGSVTRLTYDLSGNPLSLVDARGNAASFTYDANGNRLTETDRAGTTITTAYDSRNLPTKKLDPRGNGVTMRYDQVANLLETIDPVGNRSSRSIDAEGRDTGYTNGVGGTTSRSYDARGNLATIADAAGRVTRFQYDALDRRTATIHPNGAREIYVYDAASRNTAVTDANGNTTRFEYDPADRLVRVIDALGNATQNEYDAAGNLTRRTDALGRIETYAYDAGNRRTRKTLPDGSFEEFSYDAAGNRTSERDAAGRLTSYAYDGNGNLVRVTDALGGVTAYAYDNENRLIAQTDAAGRTTGFTYDALGRRASVTLPGGQREAYEYYASGSLFQTTNRNGDALVDTYDAAQRQVARTYPGGSRIDFTYTATGKLATAADTRGLTTYAYDDRDRIVEITGPDGSQIAFGYDAAGNRTSLATRTRSAGPLRTVTMEYDILNRLASVVEPGGLRTSYTYDVVGNLSSISHPNGIAVAFAYTARNFLARVEYRRGANLLERFVYMTDANGDRTRADALDGSYVSYQYDALRRLVREVQRDTGGTVVHDVVHTYDALGNRLSHMLNGGPAVAYAYDSNDRLLAAGDDAFTYDANGNTTSVTVAGQTTSYVYDFENRLAQVRPPNAGATIYTYDATGNRVRRSGPEGVVNDLIDPFDPSGVAQVVDEYDGMGMLQATYTYGHGLLSLQRDGRTSYYLRDGTLSVRALTDSSGAITDRYTYDAFGNLLAVTGATGNAYRFAGEHFDAESGLYFLRARHYSPRSGRFYSVDPFAGYPTDPMSLHRYLYARVNPISYVDPAGRDFSYTSLALTFSINGTISAALAAHAGKSPAEVVASGLFSGFVGVAGGVFGQALAKGAVGGLSAGLAAKGSGTVASAAASIFVKAPALVLPGTIAFAKALATTAAFRYEKAVLGEKVSGAGTAGYFMLAFGFEFAAANMGVGRAASGAGADQLKKKLQEFMLKAESKGNFAMAKQFFDEAGYVDDVAKLGIFQAFLDGGVWKLSPKTVSELVKLTTEEISGAIPGMAPAIEGVLNFGLSFFQ